jgi:hypothetical protein
MLAASYACLGHIDEARSALAEALRLQPSTTVADVKRNLLGATSDLTDRYTDGLRKAGLKE